MTEEQIRSELERLAPFHHEIALPYGLSTQGPGLTKRPLDRIRLADVLERAWRPLLELAGGSLAGRRVLDLACSCGGFSIEAARAGASRVLGVDVVDRYVEQANFLKRALELENVDFRRLAVEDVDDALGAFDVTFCFGILYHLENPVLAMKRVASVTERMIVVDTRIYEEHPEQPYWLMKFRGPSESEATASTSLWRTTQSCQFVPTALAVEQLLRHLGFATVHRIDPPESGHRGQYKPGSWATFIGVRDG